MSYLQPDFFRFGTDSLWLCEEIKNLCSIPVVRVLELGAGSGVISCELGAHYTQAHFTCLELQSGFLPFLQENLQQHLFQRSCVIQGSVAEYNLQSDEVFDLIVFNPPYFEVSASRPSPQLEREICRKHVVGSWEDWMECVLRGLAPEGEALWVHRREMPVPKGLSSERVSFLGELGVWRARRLNVE